MKVKTSDYTIKGVLLMEYEDRRQRPVAYLSNLLNETKQNYKIHNKKILVVIQKLENQRHLLEGVEFQFEVQTDYKNLEYFIKVQKLNCRQAR